MNRLEKKSRINDAQFNQDSAVVLKHAPQLGLILVTQKHINCTLEFNWKPISLVSQGKCDLSLSQTPV